jgi:hypothetical protein
MRFYLVLIKENKWALRNQVLFKQYEVQAAP